MAEQQLILFDYAGLEPEARIVVQQKTGEIRDRVNRIKENYVEVGQRLREVKARLEHGQFGSWLQAEFAWSQDTAQNLMRVSEMVEQNRKFSEFGGHIAQSAMYLLAAPSTPPEAREDALARAEAGEQVSHSAAKAIVNEHKAPPTPQQLARTFQPTPPATQDVPAPKPYVPQHSTAAGPPPAPKPVVKPAPPVPPPPPPPVVGEAPLILTITVRNGSVLVGGRHGDEALGMVSVQSWGLDVWEEMGRMWGQVYGEALPEEEPVAEWLDE